MNIEIPENLIDALLAKAMAEGVTASMYARQVLERDLSGQLDQKRTRSKTEPFGGMSGEEKARAFVQWAKSHRHRPSLSDEAISRTSMYPDRW